jgi:tyrosinase
VAPVLRRQEVWKLEQQQHWHPVTEAYARAIATMKARAPNDPTGWGYQAAVHAVAAGARGDKFRDQCQHASWFFLPWHRMYLYWFERIVRATIASDPKVGDDVKKSWALPYWDYEQNPTLPPAFREPTHANAPNPLYVRERSTAINRGGSLPPQVVSAADALQKQRFAARCRAAQRDSGVP